MNASAVFDDISEHILPVLQAFRKNVRNLAVSVKADTTLLTEADLAVQSLIIGRILAADPAARIIAEESYNGNIGPETTHTFVIDPIDGTREFVDPTRREFCAAVCMLRAGKIVGSLIVAPEFSRESRSVVIKTIVESADITANGNSISARFPGGGEVVRSASVTRSKSAQLPVDAHLASAGVSVKATATSQTLDLLRVAIDTAAFSDLSPSRFDLFFRERQHLWDGLPGFALCSVAGLCISDVEGDEHLPLSETRVRAGGFSSTLVGPRAQTEWFRRQWLAARRDGTLRSTARRIDET